MRVNVWPHKRNMLARPPSHRIHHRFPLITHSNTYAKQMCRPWT